MRGDISHICNRGVEKRKIFLDTNDYIRFVDNLYLLNNKKGKLRTTKNHVYNDPELKQEDKLVEILKWTLLPNHYHLLLYEVQEGGILEFTKRLGNAYTKYFNIKNNGRSGYVFQNRAKNILLTNNEQFLYIPFYIDLNSLDLMFYDWKNDPNIDSQAAIAYMKTYEWSSFKDYFGGGSRQTIVNEELFYDLYETNKEKYQNEVDAFLRNNSSTCEVDELY